MTRFRGLVGALAAGGLAALLAGCQSHVERPACPAGQQCLEWGNTYEPATLDPQLMTTLAEFAIVGDLIMGLTADAPDASVLPGAAERWETSADGLTWTFHLRPAVWSDGEPVTADDFVFAYRRILQPDTAASYTYLTYVFKNAQAIAEGKLPASALGARAIDARTLELTLEHPAPQLPELLKHSAFYPLPRHVVERYGAAWSQPGHFVSNGPYRLVSWKLGDRVRIEKNPRFWDADKVCIDRVDFLPTSDSISAERRIKRGELDVNTSFQSNRINLLRKPGYLADYVRTHVQLSNTYVAFNTHVPALKDVRVRKALSEAVDREFMTGKLMRAGQVPAYSFVPPGIASYESGAKLDFAGKPLASRQAEARALLAAAGYGPARPLRLLLTSSNTPDATLLIQALQADWSAIGVQIDLEQREGQINFADMMARNFQLGLTAWSADFNDPMTFLSLLQSQTGPQNFGDYDSPRFDALLAAADQEADLTARANLLRRAEQTMLDDQIVIPIYFGVSRNLVSPDITGWVDNVEDFHRVRWLCEGK
ncbi:MAG TPA: peptide ABC transporter substrate-binding protein [Caulobacteraceae bacterium]